METKILCPHCGTSFALPEHESVSVGKTIGKDSNMGIIYLTPERYEAERKPYLDKVKMLGEMLGRTHGSESVQRSSDEAIKELCKWEATHKKENKDMTAINKTISKENKTMTKAEERLATLKANGVDTSKYFIINADMIGRMTDTGIEVVTDTDVSNVKKAVVSDGDVFNRRLDGRWIMAEMFQMLSYKGYGNILSGYTSALNAKGYNYQWEMLVKYNNHKFDGELHRIGKMQKDGEDISIKSLFFNKDLIIAMLDDYIWELKTYLATKDVHKCKGVPYIRLGNKYDRLTKKPHGDLFLADINKVLIAPIRECKTRIKYAENYEKMSYILGNCYMHKMIKLPYNYSMCLAFKDAYKGNGAYYTANNMIRFHGCLVRGCNTKEESLNELNRKVKESHGWQLLGWLKDDIINYNKFNFKERMKELNL